MAASNQITPGMTIKIDDNVYRVESSTKVTVAKGTPFVKTKLRDLMTDKVIEKNFKVGQSVNEVALVEHKIEYLYQEGKDYLFLDVGNLEHVMVSAEILSDAINYLKEGIELKAMFYGDGVFSVELPQFLELMIVKTESSSDKVNVSDSMKLAVLETGAKIDVPLFVEIGDVVKVDVHSGEFIQRV
jgi:elongation factor P